MSLAGSLSAYNRIEDDLRGSEGYWWKHKQKQLDKLLWGYWWYAKQRTMIYV